MKIFNHFLFYVGCLAFLSVLGCQKELFFPNTPPEVHAGNDTTINSAETILNGLAIDKESSVLNIEWRKIEGLPGDIIASPHEAITSVSSLLPGIYSFELEATDPGGLSGKDTVKITVEDNFSTVLFYDMNWHDNRDSTVPLCSIVVQNIHSYFPEGSSVRVYFRNTHFPNENWSLLKPIADISPTDHFAYEIVDNKLIIRSFHFDCDYDWPEPYSVKIEVL